MTLHTSCFPRFLSDSTGSTLSSLLNLCHGSRHERVGDCCYLLSQSQRNRISDYELDYYFRCVRQKAHALRDKVLC